MRYVSIAIGLIFSLFALVQWNDPDGLIWIILYGLIGVLWFWRLWSKPPKWLIVLMLIVTVSWNLWLVPALIQWINLGAPTITGSMKAEAPHIELVREFGGLMLCWLALIPLVLLKK